MEDQDILNLQRTLTLDGTIRDYMRSVLALLRVGKSKEAADTAAKILVEQPQDNFARRVVLEHNPLKWTGYVVVHAPSTQNMLVAQPGHEVLEINTRKLIEELSKELGIPLPKPFGKVTDLVYFNNHLCVFNDIASLDGRALDAISEDHSSLEERFCHAILTVGSDGLSISSQRKPGKPVPFHQEKNIAYDREDLARLVNEEGVSRIVREFPQVDILPVNSEKLVGILRRGNQRQSIYIISTKRHGFKTFTIKPGCKIFVERGTVYLERNSDRGEMLDLNIPVLGYIDEFFVDNTYPIRTQTGLISGFKSPGVPNDIKYFSKGGNSVMRVEDLGILCDPVHGITACEVPIHILEAFNDIARRYPQTVVEPGSPFSHKYR